MELPDFIAALCVQAGLAEGQGRQIVAAGSVNEVWHVWSASGQFILRLNKDKPVETAQQEFAVEAACYHAVESGAGPRVHSIGVFQGRAYMLMDYVKGVQGDALEAELAWRLLGEGLKRVHGTAIDQSLMQAHATTDPQQDWAKQIRRNIELLGPSDPLKNIGVYLDQDTPCLCERFSSLPNGPVGLCHGDVNPRNMIVNRDLGIFIDWGCSELTIIPYFDLQIAWTEHWLSGAPSRSELEALRIGYGWSSDEFAEIESIGRNYCLLKSFDLVRWAIDRCPARIEELASRATSLWRAIRLQGIG